MLLEELFLLPYGFTIASYNSTGIDWRILASTQKRNLKM
jgi:hypothetical protein